MRWPDRLTVAIIGCGSAGTRMARMAIRCGVPAYAITGYDSAKLRLEGLPDGIARVDLGLGRNCDPLKSEDIKADVWFICTPASRRASYYRMAMKSAIGIFAEKPFSDSSIFIEKVVDEAEARAIVTQTGYCWRWHPAVIAAKAWLKGQTMTDVHAIALCAVDMGSWPGAPYGSYGSVVQECSHELDTLRFLLGPGHVVSMHVDTIAISHNAGARSTAILRGDYTGAYLRALSIFGRGEAFSWATRSFEDSGNVIIDKRDGIVASEPLSPVGDKGEDLYFDEVSNFLAAVLDGGRPGCTWRDGLEVLRWCEQAEAVRTIS